MRASWAKKGGDRIAGLGLHVFPLFFFPMLIDILDIAFDVVSKYFPR